jgi:hypothetical protein
VIGEWVIGIDAVIGDVVIAGDVVIGRDLVIAIASDGISYRNNRLSLNLK